MPDTREGLDFRKWYWVYWKPEAKIFGKHKYRKYAPTTSLEKARLLGLQLELFGFKYLIVEEE